MITVGRYKELDKRKSMMKAVFVSVEVEVKVKVTAELKWEDTFLCWQKCWPHYYYQTLEKKNPQVFCCYACSYSHVKRLSDSQAYIVLYLYSALKCAFLTAGFLIYILKHQTDYIFIPRPQIGYLSAPLNSTSTLHLLFLFCFVFVFDMSRQEKANFPYLWAWQTLCKVKPLFIG